MLLTALGTALRVFFNLPREIQALLVGGALLASVHPGTRRILTTAFSSLASNLKLPAEVLVGVLGELTMKIGEAQLDLKVKEMAVAQVIPRRVATSLTSSIELSRKNLLEKKPSTNKSVETSTATRPVVTSQRNRLQKTSKTTIPLFGEFAKTHP